MTRGQVQFYLAPAACEPQLHVRDFCFSLSDLFQLKQALNFPSWASNFNSDWLKDLKSQKLPLCCRHAHSFQILSLNSAIILFHIFVQALDTLKIMECCLGSRDTLKKVIGPEHFTLPFSLVMPFSHESEHTKHMTLLIINLQLAVFYRQSLSCEVIDKSHGDHISSNSNSLCALPGCFQMLNFFSKVSPRFSVC